MNKLIFFILLAFFSSNVFAEDRSLKKSFETDVCTAWIDGTKKYDWSHCCIEHDLRLWAGGIKDHRDRADKELKYCVKEAATEFHANIMYFGVRLGSLSPYKMEGKGWGNAWKKSQRYDRLTLPEIKMLSEHLEDSTVPELEKVSVKDFVAELYRINGY